MKRVVHAVQAAVLAVILIVSSLSSTAQVISFADGKYEAGINIGPSFFLGDLGGSVGVGKPFVKDLDFPLTKLNKGVYFNYYPAEWVGLRAAFNHMVLEGNDAEAPSKEINSNERYMRNLSFRSSVLEAYIAAEVYPTVFFEGREELQGKFRPYGVIGIGGFKFNPKAKYNNQWVKLQPLRLEGQGFAEYPDSKPYKLTQMEIPMGLGVKYYIKENMYVGLEILHRQTFTDYVDDVSKDYYVDKNTFQNYLSPNDAAMARALYYRGKYPYIVQNGGSVDPSSIQRGDPTENDAFFSTMLKIGWRLNGNNTPNGRARRQMRCPMYY